MEEIVRTIRLAHRENMGVTEITTLDMIRSSIFLGCWWKYPNAQ